MDLSLNPKKMVWVFGLATTVLVILHVVACLPMLFMGRSYPLGFLSLDGENNLPSIFSTALLWCNALLVGCIAWAEKGKRVSRLYWVGLSLAFLGAGMDESIMVHERISDAIKCVIDTSGLFYFAWIIPFAGLVLLFAGIYFRFFLRMPADTRRHVALAGLLYIAGAVGLEMLGGAWMECHGKGTVYYLLMTIEETLEMSGSIAFIYAFSSYIDRHVTGFCLRITSDGSSAGILHSFLKDEQDG